MRKSILLTFVLLSSVMASADNYFGKVLDGEGNPLIGAAVRVVGDKTAVVTGTDGRFELSGVSGVAAKVQVSYTGFITGTYIMRPNRRETEHTIRLVPDQNALNEVVVTATKTPKSLKDVPVVTRIITSDEIKKTDATNIQDLLTEEIPGLEFGYAMSQETSLNMSGFGGSAVLFLVDGERLAGETMDNVDYSRLFLGNVSRVEIVKGASSVLYGASAVGGVVNLITKESKDPWKANVNSRYRRAGNEWRHGGNISFNSGRWNSNASLQYSDVETIRLTDVFDTESKIHNVFGGHTFNITERLTYRACDNLRLIARGGYFSRVSNRSNYDDHYTDYNGGLRAVWQMDSRQSLEHSYSYDQYDKSRYSGGQRTHDHDYSNRQHIVRGQYCHSWGRNIMTAGADCMYDYLTTYQFVNGADHSQISADVFVQFDYNPLTWLNIVAGLRNDYFSASSDNALTGRIAAMFKLPQFSVRASYAGGFRAPTLKEMHMNFDMAGIQMIYGNPRLKPERSNNFNLAVEHYGQVRRGIFNGSYSLTVSGYYNYYDRRITTTDYPGDQYREEGAIYCNEDGVKVMGIDFNMRYRAVTGIGASVSYNHLHFAGRSIESQFTQPRPHSATWRLDYEKQLCSVYKIYAGLSGRYLSRPESSYDTDKAYSLWKLTLRQTVWKGIDINVVADNLLDYRPKVYFWNSAPTAGRTWSIGVSLNLDDIL